MKSCLALLLSLAVSSIAFADAKRKPNQMTGGDPAAPAEVQYLPTTKFVTEDVVSQGYVQTVYCLSGSSSNYTLSLNGNDVKITRVSAGGSVVYEIMKGTKFIGACANIHVISR